MFIAASYSYGIDIIIGWYSTRPINTSTKKCRKNIHACRVLAFFSCPNYGYIFCPLLFQDPSLLYLIRIRGVTWQALLSLPHYRVRAFALVARDCVTCHVQNFREVTFPRVHASK